MQAFLRITNTLFLDRRFFLGRLGGWLLAALLLGPQLQAQPVLVKDINRKSTVAPEDFTHVNGTLFFTINHGRELWKTDGTEAGTVLVKDLQTNAGNARAQGFTVVNNLLFFTTRSGYVLWRSDGTAAGTVVLDSIPDIQYERFTVANGLLFFTAAGDSGYELWRSDGTAAGTVMVKDIRPGTEGSNPEHLANVGGTLYFTADDGTYGYELYRSDGTEDGTVRLSDINPETGWAFNPGNDPGFTRLGSTVYFAAEDGTGGYELYKSDGTPAGTRLVKDIWPGSGYSYPSRLTDVGGTLFFTANDGTHGQEIWKSDGTAAGTVMVKNITRGERSTSPGGFTPVNGTLFFIADNLSNGYELWKSDGTAAGTVMVKDINPGLGDAFDPYFVHELKPIAAGAMLLFKANDGTHGQELWRSDGTAAGTVLVKDINPGAPNAWPGTFTEVSGGLLLVAYQESTGFELWRTDGTAAGTTLLQDIDPGRTSSSPSGFTVAGGKVFFRADNGTVGNELWKSDGTPGGTTLVKDIIKGSDGAFENPFDNPSTGAFTRVNDLLFFKAISGSGYSLLWRSDGTAAGTFQLTDFQPAFLTEVNGTLFFLNGNSHTGQLWKSDGTVAGTVKVADIYPGVEGTNIPGLFNVNGTVFFITGNNTTSAPQGTELWKSDGTAAGTVKLKRLSASANAYWPSVFGQLNGNLFLNADGFWKSDGTAAGTVKLKDIRPSRIINVNGTLFLEAGGLWKSNGTAAGTVKLKDVALESLMEVNGTLFFSGYDERRGRELWKSDGTAAGTLPVRDIWPGETGSTPQDLTNVGGTLYFDANTQTGQELWKSDGTAAGTVMVKDINPGAGSSYAFELTDVNGTLYFRATNGTRGFELWQSDGTPGGTVPVQEIVQSPVGLLPADLLNVNGTLFFSANGGAEGRELWKYTPPAAPPAAWRINAGGGAYTSSAGEAFSADQYANAGRPGTPVTGEVGRTDEDALYQQGRVGERFTYSLPTGNGVYYVVLHFAETYWGHLVPGGQGSRRFNVDVEAHRKLTDYDIYARAGGALRAVQEAFRVVVKDGRLDIRFSQGGADLPLVSALEVFAQDAFRINVAGPAYRARSGWYLSDYYGSGGSPSGYAGGEVGATEDDELYRSNRHGSLFNYNLPTGPGTYRVTLHFAETYWGQQVQGGEGSRRFNVNAQGARRLSGYDTYQRAGGAMRAAQEQFDVTVSDQILNLAFLRGSADGSVDFAHVAAIEVVRLPPSNARLASAEVPVTGASATGVYPNPVPDKLWVRLPAGGVTATAVSDARGTVVLRNGHRRVGENELQLDVSTLRPGLYFLRVQSGAGNQRFRFVKQ